MTLEDLLRLKAQQELKMRVTDEKIKLQKQRDSLTKAVKNLRSH